MVTSLWNPLTVPIKTPPPYFSLLRRDALPGGLDALLGGLDALLGGLDALLGGLDALLGLEAVPVDGWLPVQ